MWTTPFRPNWLNSPEVDAIKLIEEKFITGREGFFCLKSSKNLTRIEALLTYWKNRFNRENIPLLRRLKSR